MKIVAKALKIMPKEAEEATPWRVELLVEYHLDIGEVWLGFVEKNWQMRSYFDAFPC